jgi:hypothetical protein
MFNSIVRRRRYDSLCVLLIKIYDVQEECGQELVKWKMKELAAWGRGIR